MLKSRKCTICKQTRRLTSFHSQGKNRRKSACKFCANRIMREKRKNYTEAQRVNRNNTAKLWRKKNPYYVKQFYGLGKYRYNNAKHSAKRKNCKWKLSIKQYYRLIKQNCVYCGSKLDNLGIGLDRKNNHIREYTAKNAVPCCGICNWVKRDYFSYNEMILIGKVIKKIKQNRIKT